jgi:hypothetical protein
METKIFTTDERGEVYLKNIPAFRQAFILASVLIVVGVVFSQLLHIYFIALTFLVAGGLAFSGVVGWCPMALMIQKMPWNTRK